VTWMSRCWASEWRRWWQNWEKVEQNKNRQLFWVWAKHFEAINALLACAVPDGQLYFYNIIWHI
jgi:hypothetical protein